MTAAKPLARYGATQGRASLAACSAELHHVPGHDAFVAGILAARRGSRAPAICPGCTLLVRPIFLKAAADTAEMPSATPDEVADAVAECVDGGARVVNLSVAVASPSPNKEKKLEEALSYAARHGAAIGLR
jgi:hypothetical protein